MKIHGEEIALIYLMYKDDLVAKIYRNNGKWSRENIIDDLNVNPLANKSNNRAIKDWLNTRNLTLKDVHPRA